MLGCVDENRHAQCLPLVRPFSRTYPSAPCQKGRVAKCRRQTPTECTLHWYSRQLFHSSIARQSRSSVTSFSDKYDCHVVNRVTYKVCWHEVLRYALMSSLRVCHRCHALFPPCCEDLGVVPYFLPAQVRGTRQVEKPSEDVGVDRLVVRGVCRIVLRLFGSTAQV